MVYEQCLSRLKSVLVWPCGKGKRFFVSYLRGERITRDQAIKAKCYECCGGEGGPCTVYTCPLFTYSQYSVKEVN